MSLFWARSEHLSITCGRRATLGRHAGLSGRRVTLGGRAGTISKHNYKAYLHYEYFTILLVFEFAHL